MAWDSLFQVDWRTGVLALLVTLISTVYLYQSWRPAFPATAPPVVKEGHPILGMTRFFTNRWGFFRENVNASRSGYFSYWLGRNRMVGLSGDEARHMVFYHQDMNMEEGINLLFGGTTRYTTEGESFNTFFLKRMARALKGDRIAKMFPQLLSDVKNWIKEMAPTGKETAITDPFESIYGVIMQLTTRMVLCEELANDKAKQKQLVRWNEMVENSTTATTIIFPKLPSWALLTRLYGGGGIYFTFDRIIKERLKSGKRHDDSLQIYLDFKDDKRHDTILLLTASLFSGLVNSGVNGSWILVYLARNAEWRSIVMNEIRTVASKYGSSSLSLPRQLEHVPLGAWENEFPMLYLCFRETIRLQTTGSVIRKNSSGHDLPIPKSHEIIPNGAYATYHLFDTHLNPAVYTDPEKWDPGRYLPGREEDKRVPDGYLGWGLGRHVCAGMRFAKLEGTMVTAFWMANFEWDIVGELPGLNFNASAAHKPSVPVKLKYWRRGD
jgi:sterol 14-demethylase